MAVAARVNDTAPASIAQSTSGVVGASALSTSVDDALAMLRHAVTDTRWTLDALAAQMELDKSLISRVLNGERPATLKFLTSLPDDVEAKFLTLYGESLGLIVVVPVHGEEAARQFIGGLFGLLAPQKRMAKADLR